MNETVFQTDDVPQVDRFDHWREVMSRTHAPLELDSERPDDFRGWQRTLQFGAVTVWPTAFSPVSIRRTPRLIKQSDPETLHLSLLLAGTAEAAWDHRETLYRPNDWATTESSRPGAFRTRQDHGLFSSVGMEIPKGLLLIPRDKADQVIGHPVSARAGIGALLANNLIKIINDSHAYRESDSLRIATVLVDLASALFAHVLETDGDLEPESWQRTLILRIRDFIDRHLHDPDLNPGAIADAHHISVSYLHRLFQADDGVTVATWIRQQRLERARRVLEDPCLRGVPVHQIATRCGFTDHSVFTRAFRIAFGLPPSEHRHQALCTPGRLRNATTTGRINGSELPGSERVLGAGAAERVGVGHDQTDDKTGPGGAGVFGAGRAKRGLGPAGTILQEQLSHGGGRPSSEAAP